MNKFLSIVLLCMALFVQFAFGQSTPLPTMDEAHAFEMRINAWMAPYRDEKAGEFDEWLSMTMEPDVTPARQHPITSRIQRFIVEHREEYILLREVDLRRYPALDHYLSNYELASDFQDNMKKELQEELGPIDDELNRLQDLTNHRALDVSSLKFITSLVNSYVFDHLSEISGITIADFSLNNMFGERIFIDDVQDDQYRITFLNRLYALQYDWNIRTNRISIPNYTSTLERKRPKDGWLMRGRSPTIPGS